MILLCILIFPLVVLSDLLKMNKYGATLRAAARGVFCCPLCRLCAAVGGFCLWVSVGATLWAATSSGLL